MLLIKNYFLCHDFFNFNCFSNTNLYRRQFFNMTNFSLEFYYCFVPQKLKIV